MKPLLNRGFTRYTTRNFGLAASLDAHSSSGRRASTSVSNLNHARGVDRYASVAGSMVLLGPPRSGKGMLYTESIGADKPTP